MSQSADPSSNTRKQLLLSRLCVSCSLCLELTSPRWAWDLFPYSSQASLMSHHPKAFPDPPGKTAHLPCVSMSLFTSLLWEILHLATLLMILMIFWWFLEKSICVYRQSIFYTLRSSFTVDHLYGHKWICYAEFALITFLLMTFPRDLDWLRQGYISRAVKWHRVIWKNCFVLDSHQWKVRSLRNLALLVGDARFCPYLWFSKNSLWEEENFLTLYISQKQRKPHAY